MKQLTLDFITWRAGGAGSPLDGGNKIGSGDTALRNEEGFMCCIGQFSLQCDFTIKDIIKRGEPGELNKEMPLFNQERYYDDGYINTALSRELMTINDNPDTTWKEKLIAIHAELKKHYIELIVINTPEPITFS